MGQRPAETSEDRVVSREEAARFCARVRESGGTIALTNGCFDLLHAGHVHILERARQLADVLVVGVNSDASVAHLKGPVRPVVGERDRARVVAALRAVDRVVVFDEPTAVALVESIRPDVYVKGGDYTPEALPEREAAERVGARVVFVPLLEGRSTTALLARLGRPQG